ncbi:insulin receptor substrate 2-like [Lethenteron reissneri]|uniref:insulin receptor substrate 2-like n=1 Tax=Lethenteron reissneri TaxID=7753 RepID=UPI002AB5F800|nr:insulin receptor substrate 2-like [Lethenteron reissneri]
MTGAAVERSDARAPYGLAVFADAGYLALAADDEAQRRAWLGALRAHLPPAAGGGAGPPLAAWEGRLWSRGGAEVLRAGPCRVYVHARSLRFASPATGPLADATAVTINLADIKCYGHVRDCFSVKWDTHSELGVGLIWMKLEEGAAAAAALHGAVLRARLGLPSHELGKEDDAGDVECEAAGSKSTEN